MQSGEERADMPAGRPLRDRDRLSAPRSRGLTGKPRFFHLCSRGGARAQDVSGTGSGRGGVASAPRRRDRGKSGMKPTRRTEGLVVTEVMGEVLVYDLERHRAHCLNRAAAVVFKHCDGTRSVEELAGLLGRELGAPADPDCVWLALDRLAKACLLRRRVKRPPKAGRLSRREVVRRVGIAVLLPAVTSVLAPTPAQAVATCVSSCAGQA